MKDLSKNPPSLPAAAAADLELLPRREEIAAEVLVVVVGAWMAVPAKNKLKNERQCCRITLWPNFSPSYLSATANTS